MTLLWPLLRALAALSPRRALDHLVEAFEALASDLRLLRGLAERVEAHRLLVPGTSAMLRRAHDTLLLRFGARTPRWLGAFVRAFVDALGAPPGPAALARLSALDRGRLPDDPRALVAGWIAERDALVDRPLRAFVRSLTKDALDALVSTHPLPFGRRSLPWDDSKWPSLLARLGSEIRGVARGPMRALAAALGDRRDAVGRLARGAPPTPHLDRDIPLDDRGALVLRYLDKRRDAIAFLRFADSVTCCYASDSTLYRDGGVRRDTQFMILSLFRDPLSFCFQVRRRLGPLAEPFGFVFGSFALCEGRPAVMLNGVYLRRQSKVLRFAILEAIERDLCAPLGIRHVAVGCRYGGEGPLPPAYQVERRCARRLRALVDAGGLATHVYDDLSVVVNTDFRTECDTYWRTLDTATAAEPPGA